MAQSLDFTRFIRKIDYCFLIKYQVKFNHKKRVEPRTPGSSRLIRYSVSYLIKSPEYRAIYAGAFSIL